MLKENLYGGRSAGKYVLKGLMKWISKQDHTSTDLDPFLYHKWVGQEFFIFAASIDNFIVSPSSPGLIDELNDILKSKFDVNRRSYLAKIGLRGYQVGQ